MQGSLLLIPCKQQFLILLLIKQWVDQCFTKKYRKRIYGRGRHFENEAERMWRGRVPDSDGSWERKLNTGNGIVAGPRTNDKKRGNVLNGKWEIQTVTISKLIQWSIKRQLFKHLLKLHTCEENSSEIWAFFLDPWQKMLRGKYFSVGCHG